MPCLACTCVVKSLFGFDYNCPSRYNPSMKTRGQKRLFEITYGTIAKWCDMAEGSVRNAVHQKRLDPKDIHGLIQWVNQRRSRKGLPSIGDPTAEPILPIPVNPDAETTTPQSAPKQDTPKLPTSRLTHSPTCKCSECYRSLKSRKA